MGVTVGIPTSAGGLPRTRAALDYARQLHAGESREAHNRRLAQYRECLTLPQARVPGSPHVWQLDAELSKLSRDTHGQRARRRSRGPLDTQ